MSESFYNDILAFKQQHSHLLPDAHKAQALVMQLFETLFLTNASAPHSDDEIRIRMHQLQVNLRQLLLTAGYDNEKAKAEAELFFEALPVIFELLTGDANAIYQADPAATHMGEVLVAYPGFFATAVHRFAHQLYKQKVPLLPRILGEYVHGRTGIDIHPGASIGPSFVIDHGTGVVIGETSVIGSHVKIFQGVTLGALSVQKDKAQQKRHPTIEDRAVIYSGATILGGDTVVGHDSVIGGNVWLTKSVQPFSVVFHEARVTIQDKKII